MRTDLQNIQPLAPRVYQYSLDWRFLLPIADSQKVHVVFEQDDEFSQALEKAGIPLSNQHSFSDIQQNDRTNIQYLVFPFGLPARWVSTQPEDQSEFYRTYRQLIEPDGHFLIGFNNALYARSHTKYHASTPRRAVSRLRQAGFKFIKVFGAMPSLSIPEYIFDLNPQPVQFALSQRFRRKPAIRQTLQLLVHTIGISRFANLLPCYLAVAAA